MKRRWGLTMLVLATAWVGLPMAARGADGDILKAVPDNAWAVLVVRNVGELDQKVTGLLQQLNADPMSLLAMAKGAMGLSAGINDGGAAAVVFMPSPAVMAEPQKSLAILIPTQDYAALVASLSPEDAGEGISKVMIAMEESYLVQQGTFAVLGPAPESVKAIVAAASGPGIGSTWTSHQLERFSQDDITLVINLKSVFVDPMISGMIVSMAAMSGQQVTPEQLQEWETVVVSVRLEKDGVRLGVYTGFKEGSDTAKLWAKGETTSSTMLTGLPGEKYVMAAGMKQDAAGAAAVADSMEKEIQKGAQTLPPGVDQAKMTEMITQMAGMYRDLRDLAFSVTALPEGGDGLLGFAKVATFEKGAAEKCSKIADILQTIGAAFPMPEVQKALQSVKYTAGAETVGGVAVNHLTIAVDQLEGMTPEKLAQLKKVVGAEGLVFRIAAIDDQHVAATLGGGTARLTKVIELVQGKAAPLADDAGIKKAAAMLPTNRYFEAYLAADTMLNLVKSIGTAIGEDPEIPFTVPVVDAPLAVVMAPVTNKGLQTDIAIPMALISAAKDVAVSQGGAAPAEEPAGSPTAVPTEPGASE